MNIRDPNLARRVIAAIAAGMALILPYAAQALSIGDITLQSRLGERLRAQVSLTIANKERIDDSCLSLLPAPAGEDSTGYLTSADLSLQTKGTRHYISIVSRKPFNDAFARLRLEIKCPNMGLIIKTFNVLPDLEPPVNAPITPDETRTASPVPKAQPAAPAVHRKQASVPAAKKHRIKKSSRPAKKHRRPSTRSAGKTEPVFRLKLSGDPIDESRIGKITPEERASLLAQQRLLDADDQMASFLALQHQVKLLQQELGEIKLQLAQLGPLPVPTTSQVAAATSEAGMTAKPPARQNATTSTKPPVVWQDDSYVQNALFAALGLLAVLALWQGLRRYNKMKSRTGTSVHMGSPPILNLSPSKPLEKTKEADPARNEAPPPPPEVASPPAAPFPPPALPEETEKVAEAEEEISEEDAMLEEAKLYVAHGRPIRSVEILQEIIRRFPEKAEAWSLLLSIHSSLGKTEDFRNVAREFQQRHKDSPLWGGIQALGRTLDPDEPLFADEQGAAARLLAANMGGPRRQIGDILRDMGVLSEQDLQNCLEDYDPKKHGRFGGYLVARKAITLEQLDQALLQQQGISPEMQEGELPSLQDMESLVADFDPARDGSVGDFLASRDAAASKEFSTMLQQPEVADEPTQPEIKPLFKEGETLDFVLESSSDNSVLDLEVEPADPESEMKEGETLDFEIESAPPPPEPQSTPRNASLDFPEIQLNFSDELTGEQADDKNDKP